jgi:protein O-mannosyl-transferase
MSRRSHRRERVSRTGAQARPPAPARSRWTPWIVAALIAITVIVFAPIRQHDFVSWDDPYYVTENANVRAGLTWHGVAWALTTADMFYWHPMTWLSHMLDVELYGLNAGGHHLTSLFLHIASTLLLFGLLHRVTGAPGRSALVAALFAVHPLHVESVAWVAERKDVLSTFFWMLTMWAYVSYVRKPGWGRYLAVLALFALGLAAKPMLVTLPLALLLLDVWPLGRISLAVEPSNGSQPAFAPNQWSLFARLVGEKVPLIALAVTSAAVTFVSQLRVGAVQEIGTLSFESRVANALESYVAYIGKMVWPSRLAPFYPYPRSLSWWLAGAALLALAGASFAALRMGRRHPYVFVGWFWYLTTLLPVIGLVQAGGQSMADRFTYVPLIGLFLIVSWGIPDLLARWPHRHIALQTAATVAILACAATARAQVQHWKDSLALWEHTAEVTTENDLAHAKLGALLAKAGRTSEAIAHYTEAARIVDSRGSTAGTVPRGRPKDYYDSASLHNRIGLLLAPQGKIAEAHAQFVLAVRFDPHNAEAHANLGLALEQQGKTTEAIAHFAEAVRLQPDAPELHVQLATALEHEGQLDQAIREGEEAVRLGPDTADWHYDLALALARRGDTEKAVGHLQTALTLNPQPADAGEWHYNLGVMLYRQARTAEAIQHVETALRLDPRNPDGAEWHYNLALMLARQGDTAAVIEHLETALKLDPQHRSARQTLDDLAKGRKGLARALRAVER